ncbi:phosphatidate cytidylyltransferase [Emticicia oligotrophica DSM 17448]|uniref:Phosphatidate cytidylyltransferase n=1 Tax=Emticicia oligotrophica (strain DSM 17448 / CIP 109782 / MTCC 6937 / GPTSA100-15) TaxID=929562 RepID=A0ABM5N450_EMTOG|nr:phosphatidate cytidylyltransferase [Emticicia oligotrophica]AFK04252.1 phosphatidate cytidylyltransferase [Emticicia oligotrophica DSM 17448]
MTSRLNQLPNLTQRIIAAIIGVSIILAAVLYNEWTFWVLFLTISILTQREFYKLLKLDENHPLSFYGIFCGIVLNTLTFFIEKEYLPFKFYYLIVPLLTSTFFIKLYRKKDTKPFANLGYTFLGIIYVAVPFALINEMVLTDTIGYAPQLILGCLFILWANDTGAYFAGRFLGKRKLFERVSPKKTWEGFVGGAITSLLVAFILTKYFDNLLSWQWYGISVIIFITGTLGDLVESLFKRSISIKDSGDMIPGHGGFMDRFDGLLLSMPFIVTFLKIFG